MKEKCFRGKSAAATAVCTEKRRRSWKSGILLPVLITAMVFPAACSKRPEAELSAESFYGEEGFSYEEISWGSNVEKVEEQLECSFDETAEKVEANNKTISEIYKNARQVSMYGYEGLEVLNFLHHGLSSARVVFEMPDKDTYLDSLAETIIRDMQNAYGKEKELSLSNKFYGSDGKFGKINYYLWQCDGEKGKESSLFIRVIKNLDDKVTTVCIDLEDGLTEIPQPAV